MKLKSPFWAQSMRLHYIHIYILYKMLVSCIMPRKAISSLIHNTYICACVWPQCCHMYGHSAVYQVAQHASLHTSFHCPVPPSHRGHLLLEIRMWLMTFSSANNKQQPTGPGLWDRTNPRHLTASGHRQPEWEAEVQDLSDRVPSAQLHHLQESGGTRQRRCVLDGH